MRVEVLAREEIEEKMLMTPGDIVMMLNEMGGMRVQATSPSLGAASVRIQGMRGRYTRVLSDGLPLFGEVGGLGLLQIPPMDLGQVEVIKGVASALYGAGAMGGVVNLLSRRPDDEPARGVPAQSIDARRHRRGDVPVGAVSPAAGARRCSAAATGRSTTDVDDDAWADLAGYTRAVVRPRLFWDGGSGRTFFATTGFTYEDRDGGTLDGEVLPATGEPYVEALETRRYDAGALGQFLAEGPLRRDGARGGGAPAPRSPVRRNPRGRSSRHRVRRDRRARKRRPADVGRRPGVRTRRLHARTTCRDSTTPSPCRACSCRTTST